MAVSAQYSVTIRVELDARQEPLGKLTAAIAEAGGALQGVDLVPGAGAEGKRVREFTIDAQRPRALGADPARDRLDPRRRVLDYIDRTLRDAPRRQDREHNKYPLKTRDDLSMAYTPGVARVCQDIADDRTKAFEFTIKKNTVAVVSDGTRRARPRRHRPRGRDARDGGQGDAVQGVRRASTPSRSASTPTTPRRSSRRSKLIAPTFGGINLEDISAPRCFEIEDRLKEELDIPVFHDDQHGTAVVTMAALFNALKIVGKPIESLRVLMLGLGAAGVACTKMMLASRRHRHHRLRPPGRALDRAARTTTTAR